MALNIKKILEDPLESCYAVARLCHGSEDFLLVGSEIDGAAFAYNLNNDLEKTVLWEKVGGTMSIIQVPGSLDFLATQRFYPGFNSKDCQIVHGRYQGDGQWTVSPLTDFPYLHRFDLIEDKAGQCLFVGCTIANSKAFIEDWSDNGKIFVGRFDRSTVQLVELTELPLRLLKNHGYYEVHDEGYSLITAVEGIVKLTYPDFSDTGDWRLDILFGEETSDIVQVDLTGDGSKENIIIQGFHGDHFRILSADYQEELYRHPELTEFGHAIWSGELLGKNRVVFGWRAGKADLMVFQMEDRQVEAIMVEADSSSSNALAFEKDGKAYIFSANNGRHHVALYEMTN